MNELYISFRLMTEPSKPPAARSLKKRQTFDLSMSKRVLNQDFSKGTSQ
jgi:hypothetical protein